MRYRHRIARFTVLLAITCGCLRPVCAQLAPPRTHALRFAQPRTALAPQHPNLVLGDSFTIETWIYLDQLSDFLILGSSKEQQPLEAYDIGFIDGGSTLVFNIAPESGPSAFASYEHDIAVGSWTHIAGTLSAGTLSLFVNGVQVASSTLSGTPTQDPSLRFAIGNSFHNPFVGFRGAISEVRVWSRGLSPEELAANAATRLDGTESQLVAYWPLDDGSGILAKDRGPNGLDLDLQGAPDQSVPQWVNVAFLSSDPIFRLEKTIEVSEQRLNPGMLVDFDSDGDLDLVANVFAEAQQLTPMVTYTNDGNGNFIIDPDVIQGELLVHGLNNSNGFAIADFNGDGRDDLWLADGGIDSPPYLGGQSRLVLQTPDGHLRDETAQRVPTISIFSHDVAIGDIDGDGDIDVLEPNISPGPPVVHYINDGQGFFSLDTTRTDPDYHRRVGTWAAVHLDVDLDGDLDLAIGVNNTPRDGLLINDGSGFLLPAADEAMPQKPQSADEPPWLTTVLVTADLDQDGYPDLLRYMHSLGFVSGRLQLLLNDQSTRFQLSPEGLPQGFNAGTEVQLADFNGDALIDIVAPGNGKTTRLWYNRGGALFVNAEDVFPFFDKNLNDFLPGDIDGDGDVDLVDLDEFFILRNQRPFDISQIPRPELVSVTPNRGPVGTAVVFSGQHLRGAVAVEFAGWSAEFAVDSDAQITATVPTGAESGAVAITLPTGVLISAFTVLGPSLGSLIPDHGAVNQSVTITGSNFVDVAEVTFNGVPALFETQSPSQILAVVPPDASSGPVRVVTADGEQSTDFSFQVGPAPPAQGYMLGFGCAHVAIAPFDQALDLGSAYTIEAWILWEGNLSPNNAVIIGKPFSSAAEDPPDNFDPDLQHAPYLLTFDSEFHLQFIESSGPATEVTRARNEAVLGGGAWTHVAGTSDGDSLRLYVNGAEVGRNAALGPPLADTPAPLRHRRRRRARRRALQLWPGRFPAAGARMGPRSVGGGVDRKFDPHADRQRIRSHRLLAAGRRRWPDRPRPRPAQHPADARGGARGGCQRPPLAAGAGCRRAPDPLGYPGPRWTPDRSAHFGTTLLRAGASAVRRLSGHAIRLCGRYPGHRHRAHWRDERSDPARHGARHGRDRILGTAGSSRATRPAPVFRAYIRQSVARRRAQPRRRVCYRHVGLCPAKGGRRAGGNQIRGQYLPVLLSQYG